MVSKRAEFMATILNGEGLASSDFIEAGAASPILPLIFPMRLAGPSGRHGHGHGHEHGILDSAPHP